MIVMSKPIFIIYLSTSFEAEKTEELQELKIDLVDIIFKKQE